MQMHDSHDHDAFRILHLDEGQIDRRSICNLDTIGLLLVHFTTSAL